MSLAAVVRSESKLLLPTYDRQRVLFERGRGVYLWDSRGKRYLDFLSGIGVNALGHAHPVIQSTLKRQAGRLIHVSNLFFHEYQAELAKRLTKISGLDKAFFCNSGTEAWEGALKTGARLCAHPEQQRPQSQVASAGAGEFLSRPHFRLAGHHRAGKISSSVCAAGAGSRVCRASTMLTT